MKLSNNLRSLVARVLFLCFLVSVPFMAHAEAGHERKMISSRTQRTLLIGQALLCAPNNDPVLTRRGSEYCYTPVAIPHAVVQIRRVGAAKDALITANPRGLFRARLKPGQYELRIAPARVYCIALDQDAAVECRVFEFDDLYANDPVLAGRTIAVHGRTRRTLLKFYERGGM